MDRSVAVVPRHEPTFAQGYAVASNGNRVFLIDLATGRTTRRVPIRSDAGGKAETFYDPGDKYIAGGALENFSGLQLGIFYAY